MKNYTQNKYQADTFITYFHVNLDNIIIFYASGRKDTISLTDDNINRLLAQMELQLNESNRFEEKYLERLNSASNNIKKTIIIDIVVILSSLFLRFPLLNLTLMPNLIMFRDYYKEYKECNDELKEIKKNKYYMKEKSNFEEYNKIIDKIKKSNNPKYTDNVKININTIHSMSYEELVKFRDKLINVKAILNNDDITIDEISDTLVR